MEYVLFFNQTAEEFERLQDPNLPPEGLAPWKAYMDAMVSAGVLRGGNRLAPPWTATTIRERGGTRQIQDGPFADTREMASGYVVIEVASFDEALKWAAMSPSTAVGSTEIRPLAAPPR
ncbi:MAG: hypothetical protein CTY25_04045 [Methylobacterium sp.]|nr:MAG: hypothetical protein CTY25_04045 [Methylobacterium sp.]